MHNFTISFGGVPFVTAIFTGFTGAQMFAQELAKGAAFQMVCSAGCCYMSDMGETELARIRAEWLDFKGLSEGTWCDACEVSLVWYEGSDLCRKCSMDAMYAEEAEYTENVIQARCDAFGVSRQTVEAEEEREIWGESFDAEIEAELDWSERVEQIAAQGLRYVAI